jgi:hypothetical protein
MNDLRHERYSQAASAFAAIPNLKSAPSSWIGLVGALRLAGRADEALTEASALVARFPQHCEARVMLAALRNERHEAAAAHKLVDRALAAAGQDPALPADLRCGLHAAAALLNGDLAGGLLDRITRSEPSLRAFAEVVMGQSGTMWIDPRLYPWSLVARQPAVAAATERLAAAYSQQRDVARTALAGLP